MTVKLMVVIAALVGIVAVAVSQPSARKGPVFTNDGQLVLPSGFRKWVFMGGPITPNALNNGKAPFPEFHSVYIELDNLRYYQSHGKFPEGTVLVKELTLTQTGKYPDGSVDSAAGRGYYPSALHGLDVMVKDSKRFKGTNDWGFFTFGHHAPPYQSTAKEMSSAECASCHIAGVSKTDMVWVQYYPLLRAPLE
jgi:Cytochrome P460